MYPIRYYLDDIPSLRRIRVIEEVRFDGFIEKAESDLEGPTTSRA